ncbi:hypothetical protein Acr_00g0046500 [Actinidia rufa]|uniref:Uncharacterized protein n=1 Tax=Actinidia rufa TaxID=165716 RepID=A0A7J0DJK6_9ERIC|nr:hypothetical protein Acr_00g0046500 [Actinidia rufa]
MREPTLPPREGQDRRQRRSHVNLDSWTNNKSVTSNKRRGSPDQIDSGRDLRETLNAKQTESATCALSSTTKGRRPRAKPSLLQELQKAVLETNNEIEECSEELAMASYKLRLTPRERLWENLTLNPSTDLQDLMSRVEMFAQLEMMSNRQKKLQGRLPEERDHSKGDKELSSPEGLPRPTSLRWALEGIRRPGKDSSRRSQGSSVEVMYYLFKQLKLSQLDLKLARALWWGSTLNLTGPREPMKGVASTLHQVIKFTNPRHEETLYRDRVAAKQCYLATISTKAAIKKVQLIEEEREVLEDVGRDPKAKVAEDLICYELDEPSSNRFFLTGANLEERERTELIQRGESSEEGPPAIQSIPGDQEVIQGPPQNAETTVGGDISGVPEVISEPPQIDPATTWKMFVDGARNLGAEAGIVLKSSKYLFDNRGWTIAVNLISAPNHEMPKESVLVNTELGPSWMDLIVNFIRHDKLSEDKKEVHKLRIKATRLWISPSRDLYKKSYLGSYLLCVHPSLVENVFFEIHEGMQTTLRGKIIGSPSSNSGLLLYNKLSPTTALRVGPQETRHLRHGDMLPTMPHEHGWVSHLPTDTVVGASSGHERLAKIANASEQIFGEGTEWKSGFEGEWSKHVNGVQVH